MVAAGETESALWYINELAPRCIRKKPLPNELAYNVRLVAKLGAN